MLSRALAIKGICNAASLRTTPVCFQRLQTTTKTLDITEVQEKTLMNVDFNDPKSVESHKKAVSLLLKQELPKPYDGPERDHVNFPRRKMPARAEKVRMLMFPDSWFQFFYKKTGVTGPYVFGAGLITFMLSKEWYVVEHEFSTGCALFFLCYLAVKKFGPATAAYAEKLQKEEEAKLENMKTDAIAKLDGIIEQGKKSVWHAEGQKILMEAKRENILMQLESEYRRRMMNAYTAVKKRLDYHLDYQSTQRKQEQKHMVDWVVNSVVKSITPQQEKEALQKCLDDLKLLSAKA